MIPIFSLYASLIQIYLKGNLPRQTFTLSQSVKTASVPSVTLPGGQGGLGHVPAHPLSHHSVIISDSFLLSDFMAVSVLF